MDYSQSMLKQLNTKNSKDSRICKLLVLYVTYTDLKATAIFISKTEPYQHHSAAVIKIQYKTIQDKHSMYIIFV